MRKKKIYILHKEELDESIFDKNLNQTPLSEGPTVFQQMYADANLKLEPLSDDEDDTQNAQMETEKPEPEISQTPLYRTLQDLFSGASHTLPAPLLLYDTFMDRLLRKNVSEEENKSDDIGEKITEKSEILVGNDVVKDGKSYEEIERETLENIQTLSHKNEPSQDQHQVLLDFFNNFLISDAPISVKIPQPLTSPKSPAETVQPRKKRKRKSDEISPNSKKIPRKSLVKNGQKVEKDSERKSGKNKKGQILHKKLSGENIREKFADKYVEKPTEYSDEKSEDKSTEITEEKSLNKSKKQSAEKEDGTIRGTRSVTPRKRPKSKNLKRARTLSK